MAAKQIENFESLVDLKFLAEKLFLSRDFIDDAIKLHGFPVYKIGTVKRFRLSEVEKWLKERKING